MATRLHTWRLSWRPLGAWIAAAILAGAFYGVGGALLDLWAGPEEADAFPHDALQLTLILAAGFLILGAALFLLTSVVSRLMPWPRPWVEAALAAAALFFLTHSEDTLTLSIDTPQGTLGPNDHPAAFILAHIMPPIAGALFGWLYWRLAGKPR